MTIAASNFAVKESENSYTINLMVDGMHCPSCVAIIENALKKQSEITFARLNLSTKRLKISWNGLKTKADEWVQLINNMGYTALPFDSESSNTLEQQESKFLLRTLAVSAFASMNLMLFSIPLWSSSSAEMGEATRTMFHWIQAIIAIPTIAYCGIPFYSSALKALRSGHTNMDVPISVAIILATLMSLFETINFGEHSYFDSAVMLVFFLLIGRYLEARARGKAREAAKHLLKSLSGFATISLEDGKNQTIPITEIKEGMIVIVASGEKISADGVIISGESEIDNSLITGESIPHNAKIGDNVFAGTLNISSAIRIKVSKPHEKSLISEIVKLMETAEQSQAHYVTLADRISKWYTPVVHILALATFVGWMVLSNSTSWQVALLYSATVLIITCPCALGLAVPVVQILASSRLMRGGILLKSGSALERMAGITHAVFDKTGTLTLGKPKLINAEKISSSDMKIAASMAANSKHPLSIAITKEYDGELLSLNTTEISGSGLESEYDGSIFRLGKPEWCVSNLEDLSNHSNVSNIALSKDGNLVTQFEFTDELKSDAHYVIKELNKIGIKTSLLSGDNPEITKSIAQELSISEFKGGLNPKEKNEIIQSMKQNGFNVLMVGDGLNDAPSLSSATVSMSPSSAIDITQNAADIVFQGEKLEPILKALKTAKFSQRLVKENFFLATIYNVIAIPIAVLGYVTPLIAAIAMSSSSIIVILNAMRLRF